MATRSTVPVIVAIAVFLPACAVIDASGRTSLASKTVPVRLEGARETPAPSSVIAAAATAPVLQGQAQQQEGTEEEETEEGEAEEPEELPEEEPAPVPASPVGAKEGAPAVPTAPQAVPSPAPSMPAGQPGRPQYVSLNFDNADLELVLRSIADITGINFILAPGVKAPVTMHANKVPAGEVFSMLEAILEVNNLAAVRAGSVYKIVPLAAAEQESQEIRVGKEVADDRGIGVYLTQIVRLDHLSAEEMGRILQPFLGRGAKLAVHKETNSLIIGGLTSTVRRLLETIKALDTPAKRDNVQRIFVYFVENVKAVELANILNTLYGRREALPRAPTPGAPGVSGARPGQPPARPGAPPPPPAPAPGQPPAPVPLPGATLPPGVEPAPGEVMGEVTIVPDDATNAIVIRTSPRNWEFIEATIKQLDIVPKQVVIELFLAQIRLTDTFNFSLEEIIRSGQFLIAGTYGAAPIATAIAGTVQKGRAPATGLTFAFVDKDNVRAVLNNIAQVTKVEVLATPHLLTANNKEAKIQIGQEVPIITGEQSTSALQTGGTTTPFKTVQQKDIGIIMGIKPHVNEKRLVTLDIESENIAVDQSNFGGTGSASFLKTTAKTSVVVEDGQTLLIGGIIRSDKSKGYTGIPFLSQIPLLGYLFRGSSDTFDRNELVILVTPHVIASPDEGRAITERFKGRVESLEPLLKSSPKTSPSGLAPKLE